MPRTRAKLTDKQERIIVQCQLMGLTTADMTQISNRLRVLEKERDFKAEVDAAIQGMSWEIKIPKKHYVITDTRGRVYNCILNKKTHRYWDKAARVDWDIDVKHMSSARFKNKTFNNVYVGSSHDEVVSVCPNKDKYLWRLIDAINSKRFD
jgi:hypothetical protein